MYGEDIKIKGLSSQEGINGLLKEYDTIMAIILNINKESTDGHTVSGQSLDYLEAASK